MTNKLTETIAASASGGPAAQGAKQVLDPLLFELWGSRLIEASAGTGKTWTIAALYVRLVLGHGGAQGFPRPLLPADILVMTFTRAATRELSDRIRQRLLNAAQCFRGEQAVASGDRFMADLMASYGNPAARRQAALALALAAQSMDAAAVHTIDAWCQRMLREHAFDSGSLFDEALVADEQAMRIEAAQDYWRQQCYPLAPEVLALALSVWSNPDKLLSDLQGLFLQDLPAEAGQGTLGEVLLQASQARHQALGQLKAGWAERAQTMRDWLDAQIADHKKNWNGKRLRPGFYITWLDELRAWAQGTSASDKPQLGTGWQRLTPEGLQAARTAAAPALDLPPEFAALAGLQITIDALPKVAVAARLHAAAGVAQRLLLLKRQSGSFGFSDMLRRLHTALRGPNGQSLRARILAQHPVALIDEFQDTSPLQYQIFDSIYQTQANHRHSALLLIGDPKQSIYGFRGADIQSYLQARQATTGRHYVLETNFRSTGPLVEVVNHWFEQAEAARTAGAFMYRQGPHNGLPFVSVKAGGRKETLRTAQGPMPALSLVHDLQLLGGREMRAVFAARCAEQIVTWLNDPQAGFYGGNEEAGGFQALRPADIAVLVRTGKEAAAVRCALDSRGLASVYLSDKDSVFDSAEAQDLVHWLRAVASPQDLRLVRAALATRTIGLSLDELGWLAEHEEALDARCDQLRQLRSVWQTQGVLAMLRQTLHQLSLPLHWLAQTGGERKLTNFLHLAELMQTASVGLDGEAALIRWLLAETGQEGRQNDEQVLRLESDADLVKVVTIHKSKGLEYPLVCLPYAASFRQKNKKSTNFVSLTDETGGRQLLLDIDAQALARADQDRLREDLRLLYVALTRARHALWLGFSTLKIGNKLECMTHLSALGYLLGGAEPRAAEDWLMPLRHLAQSSPGMVLQPLEQATFCTPLIQPQEPAELPAPAAYSAKFERDWAIGSFSRMARDLTPVMAGSELSPLRKARPADDEDSSQPAPAQTDAGPDLASGPGGAGAMPWHTFTRGAEAGNFLHAQLQWLAGEEFALPQRPALAERLRRNCQRSGRTAQADGLLVWLTEVVQTVLPGPEVALSGLRHALPEMEFWLPTRAMPNREVDAHCQAHLLPGLPRPGLAQRQLQGMLMGFADLVFEHGGRYWVLDYKSNHLGGDDSAYSTQALARAMAEHRYDVQAALYMLALHRLLKLRLGQSYRAEQHLGGAVYLFLRGIKGPQRGVCLLPACLPLLEALEAMLFEEVAPI